MFILLLRSGPSRNCGPALLNPCVCGLWPSAMPHYRPQSRRTSNEVGERFPSARPLKLMAVKVDPPVGMLVLIGPISLCIFNLCVKILGVLHLISVTTSEGRLLRGIVGVKVEMVWKSFGNREWGRPWRRSRYVVRKGMKLVEQEQSQRIYWGDSRRKTEKNNALGLCIEKCSQWCVVCSMFSS